MVLESMVLPATILTGHYFTAAIAYWFLYFALHMVAKAKGRTTQSLAHVFVTPSNRAVYIMPEALQTVQGETHELGYSLVYLAVEDAIVGAIELQIVFPKHFKRMIARFCSLTIHST